MALHITKASESIQVDRLITIIFGQPGCGKSTLGFTADRPLLLDFDHGAYRAGIRRDCVQVSTWADVAQMTAQDLKPYKTLVVDTAGRALDALVVHIIQGNPKMARGGGALTLQGYGELKALFIGWVKLIKSFELDLVLLAHSEEQRGNGDDLIERLDVVGGSKSELYKVADVMGRLAIRNGKRVLNFSPTDTAFGKNPGQLPMLEVPDPQTDPDFLAGIIQQVKATLNTLTAEQQKASTVLNEWQSKFAVLAAPEHFNALIPEVAKLDEAFRDNVGRLLVKAGKAKGFEWNTETKRFTTPEKQESKANGNGAFNPLAQTTKDGMSSKQAKEIHALVGQLDIKDADSTASQLFKLPLKVDDLSKEAAGRFIAELSARAESLPFLR